MSRLRIGLVFDDTLDRPGGVGQYCLTLGAELQRRGHDVTLLVGGSGQSQVNGLDVIPLARNLDVRFHGNIIGIPILADRARVRRVASLDLDVLHVQMPYSPILAGRLISQAAPSTAVVGTFHVASQGVLSGIGARALALWSRRTLRRFNQVISVSAAADEFAARGFGIHDVVRVPNMVPSTPIPAPCDVGGAPSVVFVGRLEQRKGVQHLVDEFPAVLERVPDARLFIVGNGSLRQQLERRVADLGISSSVEFLGAVSDDDRDSLLAAADVACFPATRDESFGIVLLEGIRAGAGAVVGGDNPGYRAVLEDDERAIADPSVKGQLATKVADLLTDSALRAAVGADQQLILAKYGVEAVTDRVLDVYETALSSSRVDQDLPRS